MRTKTTERADRMLEAAARLFGTQHFHEVRMDDVAAEAGVGKGTLYRYFEDKDELYLALLERAGEQLDARIRAGVAAQTTPTGKLEALAAAIISFFDEYPHVFDLITRADAQRGLDTPWHRLRLEAIKMVRELFAEAHRSGEFEVDDPDGASLMLLGGLRAVVRFGSRPHAADQARRLVHMFLHGAVR